MLRRRGASSESSARAIHLFGEMATPLAGTPRAGLGIGIGGGAPVMGGTPLGARSQRAARAAALRREHVGSPMRASPRPRASALRRGKAQRRDVAHALFGEFGAMLPLRCAPRASLQRRRYHSETLGAHTLSPNYFFLHFLPSRPPHFARSADVPRQPTRSRTPPQRRRGPRRRGPRRSASAARFATAFRPGGARNYLQQPNNFCPLR